MRIFQNLINAWRGHCHQQNHSCEECFTALKTASEIYRDHFLAGFSLGNGGEFDTWQIMQEQTLRNFLGSALEWLSHYHGGSGDLETAIGSVKRWLSLDPLNEPAHVLLMKLFAQNGQRAAAIRQFEECKKVLLTELSLSPQAETIQTLKSILDNKNSSRLVIPLLTFPNQIGCQNIIFPSKRFHLWDARSWRMILSKTFTIQAAACSPSPGQVGVVNHAWRSKLPENICKNFPMGSISSSLRHANWLRKLSE